MRRNLGQPNRSARVEGKLQGPVTSLHSTAWTRHHQPASAVKMCVRINSTRTNPRGLGTAAKQLHQDRKVGDSGLNAPCGCTHPPSKTRAHKHGWAKLSVPLACATEGKIPRVGATRHPRIQTPKAHSPFPTSVDSRCLPKVASNPKNTQTAGPVLPKESLC